MSHRGLSCPLSVCLFRLPSLEKAKRDITRTSYEGYSVDVKGYSVDVKGCSVDVKGCSVDVKGCSVDVKGYSVDV
eukprot:9255320-Pyramimonas_sp.AAC.1